MPDNLSHEDRKRTMRAVKGSRTSPEMRLRAILAGNHIGGWKANLETLTGKPDIAFPHDRLAIFVDGCFWHGCPVCDRPLPETNRDYWQKKIGRNVKRDREVGKSLTADGWTVLRIWEHELKKGKDFAAIAARIRGVLSELHGSA